MKLIINNDFDDLFNILSSLHILSNYDYYKEQMEYRWDLKMDESLKEYAKIVQNYDNTNYYFGVNTLTASIFNNAQLQHEAKDIEDYMNLQKNLREDFLIDEIYKRLKLDINATVQETIKHLDNIEENIELKWFYMQVIENPVFHMQKAMSIIKEYLPLFEKLKREFMDEYLDFVSWINPILEKEGIDFFKNNLQYQNFEQYDEITINFSLLELTATQIFKDNSIVINLGIMYKKYVEADNSKDEMIEQTNILKILSDPTRFEILTLLSKKPAYGQELADHFQISNATISYHMDFLFSGELVIMEHKHRRIYYSINKENLIKTVSYLQETFDL